MQRICPVGKGKSIHTLFLVNCSFFFSSRAVRFASFLMFFCTLLCACSVLLSVVFRSPSPYRVGKGFWCIFVRPHELCSIFTTASYIWLINEGNDGKKIAPRCYIHLKWQLYTYLANTEPAVLSKSMAMAMTKRQKYRWFNIVKSGSFALLQCFGFTLLLWNYMRRRQSGIGAVSMPIRWVSRFLGLEKCTRWIGMGDPESSVV